MTYQFDIDLAARYGVDEAIMIANFLFWIRKNEANGKYFHDGRFWTYNSTEAFTKLFPFWSAGQIRRILKSLESQDVIITGNYNSSAYDHTLWYAFSDSFLQNHYFDFAKSTNRDCEIGKPIPDNNTDKNINNNRDNRESACACGDAPTPPISESLFADDNDYVQEERKRAKRTNERRKILFADSRYFDYEKFAAEFTEEEHRKADIYAYYQAIKNWSASDGGKKMDWIATAKIWMLMDEKKGKLVRPGNQGLSPEELKYLQDMAPSDFELGITR